MNCFVAFLRGSDGFMMNSSGFRHHIGKGREGPLDHVVTPFMDIFKGETGIRHHLQAVMNETV